MRIKSANQHPKLLVIGIDAADPVLVGNWIDDGHLPNLSALVDSGVSGSLESTPTYLSPESWTTFQCGVNAGKHGIFEFHQRFNNSYRARPVNSQDRKSRTIWSILSDAGRRVAVTGVPMTFPAEQLNGVLISSVLCPSANSSGFTHPPELAQHIRQEYGRYPLDPGWQTQASGTGLHVRSKQMIADLQLKAKIAADLYKSEPWDCFVHVFNESDFATHFLWHTLDPSHPNHESIAENEKGLMLKVFQAIDRSIGTILRLAGPETNIIVLSDHGGGPNDHGNNHLRPFLQSLGLLKLKQDLLSKMRAGAVRIVGAVAKAAPQGLVKALDQTGGGGSSFVSEYVFGQMDWAATKAFAPRLFGSGRVFLNLEGREPSGTVRDDGEREQILSLLTEELLSATDLQSGEAAVLEVHRGEDLYSGPYADSCPDLLIRWRDDTVLNGITSPNAGEISPEFTGNLGGVAVTGTHRKYGLLIAKGPSIGQGHELENARMLDIAPTLLHLLGHPVPNEMDGRVLQEMLDAEFSREHPVEYRDIPLQLGDQKIADQDEADYTDQEKAQVEKRLEDLGYF